MVVFHLLILINPLGYFPVPVIHDIIRVPQSEAEKARQKKKAHKLSKVTAKIMDPKSEQIVEKGLCLIFVKVV